jgi:hypothetical protein
MRDMKILKVKTTKTGRISTTEGSEHTEVIPNYGGFHFPAENHTPQ